MSAAEKDEWLASPPFAFTLVQKKGPPSRPSRTTAYYSPDGKSVPPKEFQREGLLPSKYNVYTRGTACQHKALLIERSKSPPGEADSMDES